MVVAAGEPRGEGDPRQGRSRAALGRLGEDAALAVYLRKGFRLVARNWRCDLGELDLVVARPGLLVFCEVKTRSGDAFGGGYEAVGWAKRRTLRRLAQSFLLRHPDAPDDVRFDVASVFVARRAPEVEIFQDAF